jgi:hypothetical protein
MFLFSYFALSFRYCLSAHLFRAACLEIGQKRAFTFSLGCFILNYNVFLVLRFSRLEFIVKRRLSGIRRVGRQLFSVSGNIAVASSGRLRWTVSYNRQSPWRWQLHYFLKRWVTQVTQSTWPVAESRSFTLTFSCLQIDLGVEWSSINSSSYTIGLLASYVSSYFWDGILVLVGWLASPSETCSVGRK